MTALPTATDGDAPCRFRLDNNTSATLKLPHGRSIGYACWGSPSGKPILYLHGIGGSRLEGANFDEVGQELGARIIAIERPGIGWSSPQPNRKLLDHPRDVQLLAEHLGLDEYAVLGISGGGPYALACAKALPPDKLKGVSVVCGLGPPDMGTRGMSLMNKLGFTMGCRYLPWLLKRQFRSSPFSGCLELSDQARMDLVHKGIADGTIKMHERDMKGLNDIDALRLVMRSTREAAIQGYDGIAEDAKVMCTDYGFRIEDIRSNLPVQLWYGTLDETIPLNHGEQIAARLGSRAQLRVEEETHGSIHTAWRKEIFANLLETFE